MQQTGIPTAQEVRGVFQEVLREPDFQAAGTSPLVRAFRAIVRWIEDLLNRWLPDFGESEARLLTWILLALCAVFAARLLMLRLKEGAGPRRLRDVDAGDTPDEPRDAEGWMAWARRSAQAGKLRDAATGIYQATILGLDARGALHYRDWKTPGDYALEVSGQDVRAPFLDFLGRFVEIAFGPREPTEEAYEALSADATRLGGTV